jgi:3-dehydroquinate synthase
MRLAELRADRKAVVIAVGGGVLGDLAGFLAATWNRGVRFVQVPTTLLAMVDSSVGGKTGINLPSAKNVVGAFWQPHLVWADLTALNSLPDREYRSGLAEVVKYGVILDPRLFAMLEANVDRILDRDPEAVASIVQRSCELKAQVVAADEFETTGLRAILNYGHTFGHALEALTGYGTLLHGEAVSIGMTMAAHLAATLERWPAAMIVRQTELLERLHLPTRINGQAASQATPDRVLQAMQLDKKTEHGQLNLILPTRLGHVETVRGVDPALIAEAIAACSASSDSQ